MQSIATHWPAVVGSSKRLLEPISIFHAGCIAGLKARMRGARRRSDVDMTKPSNTAAALSGRNPQGRGYFCAFRRYSSLVWNDQTSLLAPWTAQK